MEDALVLFGCWTDKFISYRLNPCCNGRCTRTGGYHLLSVMRGFVLILVVMEDALVHRDD